MLSDMRAEAGLIGGIRPLVKTLGRPVFVIRGSLAQGRIWLTRWGIERGALELMTVKGKPMPTRV